MNFERKNVDDLADKIVSETLSPHPRWRHIRLWASEIQAYVTAFSDAEMGVEQIALQRIIIKHEADKRAELAVRAEESPQTVNVEA